MSAVSCEVTVASSYDAIVIGTGQAGPALAGELAGSGKQVAVVERHLFGGTCVNVGCIPTKTLVATARAAHVARRAEDFGVVIDGGITVDMRRVKARKDAIVRKSNQGVESWLKGLDNCTVYEGHARFDGPHHIRVGEQELEAERIFINVGARAYVPPLPGLDRVDYLTNSGMMNVDVLPEHLVIIGGGYIGLEFAQMYRRFGSRVTLVEMGDRLIRRESEDVSATVQEILEADGVEVRLNAECVSLDKRGNTIIAAVSCDQGAPEVEGSHLLLAVGRRPNTDDLGLDAAGVDVDDRGRISVNDTLATNVPGVWALGECNGRGAFTHTAYNDYAIVAANLLRGEHRRVTDRIDCYGLYIDPPLGRVGMTERQVRESGRPALIATRPMARVGRAVEKSETQGFMKVLVDAQTEQILGAAILGVGGDEVVHSILDVMYAKAPYTVIQRAVHIHPTVSELIPTMLADLKPLKA
ncbi:MAG: FAD-containing oxidoreductase [Vicinamibacterales bacterium]|jgi:pyruvate/2-oxoglutarate dehydrogenase complex dihydrolipoamide dehydrogenase (E3) component|nr:FAD-containing oxidoreductase [Vicinamibacterales bacterium]|tara:strand:- start:498 stop:1907 length:1410 start_codon:yes stop_codon:yes gene_type:complete